MKILLRGFTSGFLLEAPCIVFFWGGAVFDLQALLPG